MHRFELDLKLENVILLSAFHVYSYKAHHVHFEPYTSDTVFLTKIVASYQLVVNNNIVLDLECSHY